MPMLAKEWLPMGHKPQTEIYREVEVVGKKTSRFKAL